MRGPVIVDRVVIVAFVLVLLAAASFAVGIAASRTSDTLIYLSIVFSLAAFVTLAIASMRARQAERETARDDPGTERLRSLDAAEAHVGPLLGGLDPAQLDMAPSWRRQQRAQREAADPLLDDDILEKQLENEQDEADFEVPVEPVVAAARGGDDLAWGFDDEDDDAEDDDAEDQEPTAAFTPILDDDVDAFETFEDDEPLDLPEPEPEPKPAGVSPASFFDQYDDLTAAEIVPFLSVLDRAGVQWVRDRERSGAKRVTVLKKAEQLLAEQGGKASRTSTRKKAPAKRAAPARRATKSTTKSTRRR